MSKKIRNLIIGGSVLLVLVIALLLLLFLPKGGEEASSGTESSTTSSTLTILIEKELDDVKSATIKNDSGEVTILRKAEDLYTIEALDGFEQKDSYYVTVMTQMARITAARTVEENAADLSKYGLDDPVATIEIAYQDGTSNTLLFGGELPTDEGTYMMVSGDKNVYAAGLTLTGYSQKKLTDFVSLTVIEEWVAPVDEEGNATAEAAVISALNITGGVPGEVLGDIPFSIINGEDSDLMADYGMSGSTWIITSPTVADLHLTNGTAIIDACNGLTAESVTTVKPTEDELETYGFSDPYAHVDFVRDGIEFSLTFGGKDEDGNRYVMVDGRQIIYAVSEDNLPWITMNVHDMLSSLIILPIIDDVATMDVMVKGENYHLTWDGTDDVELGTINGKEIEESNFRHLYEFLISAPAEEFNLAHEEGGQLLASITYHYVDKNKSDDVVEMYYLSDRRMILALNGEKSFIGRSVYIDTLAKNFVNVLNGEAPQLDW